MRVSAIRVSLAMFVTFLLLFPASALGAVESKLIDNTGNTTFYGVFIGSEDLEDAPEDAKEMVELLDPWSGWDLANMELLTSGVGLNDPNRTNIQNAINVGKVNAEPGDEFIFYYSGHGSNSGPDANGDDPDGHDNAIHPNPSNSPTTSETITDDELAQWLSGFKKSVTIVVILDSCKSGTFTDGTSDLPSIKDDQGKPIGAGHLEVMMGTGDDDGDGKVDEDQKEVPVDNDGDGQTDEDPPDGVDNDGDGKTDEDGSEQVDNDGDGKVNEDDGITYSRRSGTDEDGDGANDEDPIDGVDNDGDGKVDEDPGAKSIFTGEILKGLLENGLDNKGDITSNADANKDGITTASEAFEYARDSTASFWEGDNDSDGEADEDGAEHVPDDPGHMEQPPLPGVGFDDDADGLVNEDPPPGAPSYWESTAIPPTGRDNYPYLLVGFLAFAAGLFLLISKLISRRRHSNVS